MRYAEAAARWLPLREPSAWLALALVLTKEGGKPAIMPRADAVALLQKALALAATKGRDALAAEISAGIDLIKASAPIEVPLLVFLEREGGEVEMGVLRLSLPAASKKPAR